MQPWATKDIHQLTGKLGLTLNESEVYVFLVKKGLASGTEVYEQLSMDKSSAYRALKSLAEKNLVFKVGEERNQQFGANPPEYLLEQFEVKRTELAESKEKLAGIFEELEDFAKQSYLRKNITILEGNEGYTKFLESRLKPGVELIREIGTRSDIERYFGGAEKYDEYMRRYIKRRVEMGIYLRALISLRDEDDYLDITDKKWLKQVRVLPSSMKLGSLLTTWQDHTGFFSMEKGTIICVTIKDRLITQLINSLFEVVWEISKVKKDNE
jgi:sugar-specific transcriptional regulator TrmB